MTSQVDRADWRTPTVVLVCAGLVLTISMGIRHGFGLFLQPMSSTFGWGRETFALAMAVQNITWGATQPFAGFLADRFGTSRSSSAAQSCTCSAFSRWRTRRRRCCSCSRPAC